MKKSAQFKSVFAKATEQASSSGDFEDLPLGPYHMKLVDSKLGESKAHDPMVTQKFEVLAPEEYKGRFHWENSVISSEKSAKFLVQRLRALGYETLFQEESELVAVLDDCNTEQYEIMAEFTGRGVGANARRFFNIKEVIGGEGGEEGEDEGAKDDDASEVPDAPEESPTEDLDEEVPDVPEAEEEGEVELAVGDVIKFSMNKKKFAGTIDELDEDAGVIKLTTMKGNKREITLDQVIEVVPKA